jgi:hypothetical protein
MEETHIQITIDKRMIERIIYWVLIIALIVVAVIGWTRDGVTGSDVKDDSATQETDATDTPEPTTAEPVKEEPVVVAASCTDAKKNQDETDIDCGGAKCVKCASGSVCTAATDCIGGFCNDGKCSATAPPPGLSGKLEIDVTKVGTTKATSGALKVTSVTYKVMNGLKDPMRGMVGKVYIKATSGTDCHNQQDYYACDDSYVEFIVPNVASGANMSETHTFESADYTSKAGTYIIDESGNNPTTFNVVVYLYDEDGQKIGDKTISDAYQVK